MDKSVIDALNKEMYELSLRHYQKPLAQDVIIPPQTIIPPATNLKIDHRLKPGDYDGYLSVVAHLPPQKERNNNRLADYQFNHIFSNNAAPPSVYGNIPGMSGPISGQPHQNYSSSKDMINSRLSEFSSLTKTVNYGFSSQSSNNFEHNKIN